MEYYKVSTGLFTYRRVNKKRLGGINHQASFYIVIYSGVYQLWQELFL